MAAADLDDVNGIADAVHPLYPESPEVPAERLALFPAGCFVAEAAGRLAGYCLSHPAVFARPPALNSLLTRLPDEADCLYVHDVAILPSWRGCGLGRAAVDRVRTVAVANGADTIALVAVNDSVPYWRGLGFTVHDDPQMIAKLTSYGPEARFMFARTNRR